MAAIASSTTLPISYYSFDMANDSGNHMPSGGKTMLKTGRIYLGLAILVVVGVAQPASSQVRYSVVDLGVLEEATTSIVRGLNSANEVVGGTTGFGRGERAFLVTKGKAENLGGIPGTDSSVAHAISDDTTAVGSSNTARSIHAFIWTRKDGVRDLGTLPGDVVARHSVLIDKRRWWAIPVARTELRPSCGHGMAQFRVSVDCAPAITAEPSPSTSPATSWEHQGAVGPIVLFSGHAMAEWRISAYSRATLRAQPRGSTTRASGGLLKQQIRREPRLSLDTQ